MHLSKVIRFMVMALSATFNNSSGISWQFYWWSTRWKPPTCCKLL